MAPGPAGFQVEAGVDPVQAGDGSVVFVARHASDLPAGPAIVMTNADEDYSPQAFRALLDELLAGPEPEIESIGAAEALRELRVDAGA